MKKLVLTFVLSLMASFSFAQQGPKIEFKEETINYGDVERGKDSGKRVFEFKNIGEAPLIITNVRSTCGCTVPTKPTEPIMPGQSGKIEVQYNMSPGPISKTITVESNAVNKEGGIVALRIRGNVIVKETPNPMEKGKNILERTN